ncbi:MAG: hypothetical protein JJU36_01095 [Phycisphaeraceae bacterium]|nr:hypothetical protein [Phycisphaeraceae bacterium]
MGDQGLNQLLDRAAALAKALEEARRRAEEIGPVFLDSRGHLVTLMGNDEQTEHARLALLRRLEQIRPSGDGGEPVMLAGLYGPSGAGKSSLFNLLTGCHVPVDVVRPTTYGVCAAVPEALHQRGDLDRLFPDAQTMPLEDERQLANPEFAGRQVVWLARVQRDHREGELSVILLDVPDFNTVERGNREIAQDMLSRANLVVLVLTPEGYAAKVAVEAAAEACGLAGAMVVVFNKVQAGSAQAIWEDLLTRHVPRIKAFEARRSDGIRRGEFLGRCPVYALPFVPGGPGLEALDQAIRLDQPDGPSLRDQLHGQSARRIIQASLAEPASMLAQRTKETLESLKRKREPLDAAIQATRDDIEALADKGARQQIPIGEMVEVIISELRACQSTIARVVGKPGDMARWLFGRAGRLIRKARASQDKLESEVRSRDDHERAWRDEAGRKLGGVMRRLGQQHELIFPADMTDNHQETIARKVESALAALRGAHLPEGGDDWKDTLRRQTREWYQHNHRKAGVLLTALDSLSVGGVTVLAIDLLATGGFGGTVLGAGGAIGGAGAIFSEILRYFGFHGIAERVNEAYARQRQGELATHLESAFADPLALGKWKRARDAIDEFCEGELAETLGKVKTALPPEETAR